jgi:hypothetical protein
MPATLTRGPYITRGRGKSKPHTTMTYQLYAAADKEADLAFERAVYAFDLSSNTSTLGISDREHLPALLKSMPLGSSMTVKDVGDGWTAHFVIEIACRCCSVCGCAANRGVLNPPGCEMCKYRGAMYCSVACHIKEWGSGSISLGPVVRMRSAAVHAEYHRTKCVCM